MSATTYMNRPEEREKHRQLCLASGDSRQVSVEEQIRDMAGFDFNVTEAMLAFWNFAHVLDDLLDETGLSQDDQYAALAVIHDGITTLLLHQHDLKADERMARWVRYAISESPWTEQRKGLAHVAAAEFLRVLIENPFVLRHAISLHALFVSALLRCIGGDAMAQRNDEHSRLLAPAVSCGDVDVLIHMAYLARGFAAATFWSETRDYDRRQIEVTQTTGVED